MSNSEPHFEPLPQGPCWFRCRLRTFLVATICLGFLVALGLTIGPLTRWCARQVFGDIIFGPGVHDFPAKLTGGYVLHHTSAICILIVGPSGDVIIPPTVEQLAYDRRFILAQQQQLRPRFENDDLGDPVPGKFNYWIVDVNHSKCYGPFDETQFLAKRVELKVNPALTLRDESSFDPRKIPAPMPSGPTAPTG